MRLICRRKAPWVQRKTSFFAGGCLRRPWRLALAWSAAGKLVNVPASRVQWVHGTSIHALQRVCDIRCSSRSGWGKVSAFERSRRREHVWHCRSKPLARDISVGRPARGVVTRLSSAVPMGYTGGAVRGVLPFQRLWSRIVSIAEVDKQRVAFEPTGEEPVDPSNV